MTLVRYVLAAVLAVWCVWMAAAVAATYWPVPKKRR